MSGRGDLREYARAWEAGGGRCFLMALAGTQGLVRDVCTEVSRQRRDECRCTYTEPVGTASRAVERLIFRACSLTLDLASSIE